MMCDVRGKESSGGGWVGMKVVGAKVKESLGFTRKKQDTRARQYSEMIDIIGSVFKTSQDI